MSTIYTHVHTHTHNTPSTDITPSYERHVGLFIHYTLDIFSWSNGTLVGLKKARIVLPITLRDVCRVGLIVSLKSFDLLNDQ